MRLKNYEEAERWALLSLAVIQEINSKYYSYAQEELRKMREILSTIYLELGKFQEALDISKTLAKDNPDSPAAWRNLCRAYLALGDAGENVVEAANKATELEPGNPLNRIRLSQALLEAGKLRECLEIVPRVVEAIKEDRRRVYSVWHALSMCRFRNPIGPFPKQESENVSEEHIRLCDLSDAWLTLGNEKRALSTVQEAVGRAPKTEIDSVFWMQTLLAAGRLRQALKVARKLAKFKDTRRKEFDILCDIWSARKDTRRNWPAAERKSDLISEKHLRLCRASGAWLAVGDPEKAFEAAEKATKIFPEDTLGWVCLYRALMAAGKPEKASLAAEEIIKLAPESQGGYRLKTAAILATAFKIFILEGNPKARQFCKESLMALSAERERYMDHSSFSLRQIEKIADPKSEKTLYPTYCLPDRRKHIARVHVLKEGKLPTGENHKIFFPRGFTGDDVNSLIEKAIADSLSPEDNPSLRDLPGGDGLEWWPRDRFVKYVHGKKSEHLIRVEFIINERGYIITAMPTVGKGITAFTGKCPVSIETKSLAPYGTMIWNRESEMPVKLSVGNSKFGFRAIFNNPLLGAEGLTPIAKEQLIWLILTEGAPYEDDKYFYYRYDDYRHRFPEWREKLPPALYIKVSKKTFNAIGISDSMPGNAKRMITKASLAAMRRRAGFSAGQRVLGERQRPPEKPYDSSALPPGMISWIWQPLVERGWISIENAARLSFALEEGIFSGLFINLTSWFLATDGFPDPIGTFLIYLASAFLYGVLHDAVYRWKNGKIEKDRTPANSSYRLIFFPALGAIFRLGYLIPGLGGFASFLLAMGMHALYNNVIAPRLNLAVGMTGGTAGQKNEPVEVIPEDDHWKRLEVRLRPYFRGRFSFDRKCPLSYGRDLIQTLTANPAYAGFAEWVGRVYNEQHKGEGVYTDGKLAFKIAPGKVIKDGGKSIVLEGFYKGIAGCTRNLMVLWNGLEPPSGFSMQDYRKNIDAYGCGDVEYPRGDADFEQFLIAGTKDMLQSVAFLAQLPGTSYAVIGMDNNLRPGETCLFMASHWATRKMGLRNTYPPIEIGRLLISSGIKNIKLVESHDEGDTPPQLKVILSSKYSERAYDNFPCWRFFLLQEPFRDTSEETDEALRDIDYFKTHFEFNRTKYEQLAFVEGDYAGNIERAKELILLASRGLLLSPDYCIADQKGAERTVNQLKAYDTQGVFTPFVESEIDKQVKEAITAEARRRSKLPPPEKAETMFRKELNSWLLRKRVAALCFGQEPDEYQRRRHNALVAIAEKMNFSRILHPCFKALTTTAKDEAGSGEPNWALDDTCFNAVMKIMKNSKAAIMEFCEKTEFYTEFLPETDKREQFIGACAVELPYLLNSKSKPPLLELRKAIAAGQGTPRETEEFSAGEIDLRLCGVLVRCAYPNLVDRPEKVREIISKAQQEECPPMETRERLLDEDVKAAKASENLRLAESSLTDAKRAKKESRFDDAMKLVGEIGELIEGLDMRGNDFPDRLKEFEKELHQAAFDAALENTRRALRENGPEEALDGLAKIKPAGDNQMAKVNALKEEIAGEVKKIIAAGLSEIREELNDKCLTVEEAAAFQEKFDVLAAYRQYGVLDTEQAAELKRVESELKRRNEIIAIAKRAKELLGRFTEIKEIGELDRLENDMTAIAGLEPEIQDAICRIYSLQLPAVIKRLLAHRRTELEAAEAINAAKRAREWAARSQATPVKTPPARPARPKPTPAPTTRHTQDRRKPLPPQECLSRWRRLKDTGSIKDLRELFEEWATSMAERAAKDIALDKVEFEKFLALKEKLAELGQGASQPQPDGGKGAHPHALKRQEPLPPLKLPLLEGLKLNDLGIITNKQLKLIIHFLKDMQNARSPFSTEYMLSVFSENTLLSIELRDTFIYMAYLAKRDPEFRRLLLRVLNSAQNRDIDSIMFATTMRFPLDSARYFNPETRQAVIVFDEDFFHLNRYVSPQDGASQEAVYHVRAERIMHEFFHDNETRSWEEEVEEETAVIVKCEIPLWKITQAIGMQDNIDVLRSYPKVKEAMHRSGDFFDWMPVGMSCGNEDERHRVIREHYVKKYLPKEAYASLQSAEEIEQNAERITPLLVSTLMEWVGRRARKIEANPSGEEEKEELVLILDMPPDEIGRAKTLIEERVIKPLMRVSGNNGTIAAALKHLSVCGRGKIPVVRQRIGNKTLRPRNVIVVTSQSSMANFDKDGFEQSFVTALALPDLKAKNSVTPESYYYPYLEATFFAVIRALGAFDLKESEDGEKSELLKKYKKRLWRWYRQIPNARQLTEYQLKKLCFEKDGTGGPKKHVVIELIIPDAENFDHNTLQSLYEKIERFIRNA